MRHRFIPLERLSLSDRTLKSLKRVGINKVGEVLDMSEDELLCIRNFGEKIIQRAFWTPAGIGLAAPRDYRRVRSI